MMDKIYRSKKSNEIVDDPKNIIRELSLGLYYSKVSTVTLEKIDIENQMIFYYRVFDKNQNRTVKRIALCYPFSLKLISKKETSEITLYKLQFTNMNFLNKVIEVSLVGLISYLKLTKKGNSHRPWEFKNCMYSIIEEYINTIIDPSESFDFTSK